MEHLQKKEEIKKERERREKKKGKKRKRKRAQNSEVWEISLFKTRLQNVVWHMDRMKLPYNFSPQLTLPFAHQQGT